MPPGGTGDGVSLIGVVKDYVMPQDSTGGEGRAECIKLNHWSMGFREGRGASDRGGHSHEGFSRHTPAFTHDVPELDIVLFLLCVFVFLLFLFL